VHVHVDEPRQNDVPAKIEPSSRTGRVPDVHDAIALDDQRRATANTVEQNEIRTGQDDHARNISVMPVLGIDVGGTKTVCLLADDNACVLAEGREEGANLQGAGELALEKVLHSVMESTLSGTGVIPAAICLGIAGVDRAADEAVVRSIMRRIGYKARILVVNDALIALQAGVGDAAGIVIVSGTGSIAYGRNVHGEASRAGGWGYVLGDEGSGYWIGRLALRAVVRHADGRGRVTTLTPRLLNHFGVQKAAELINKVYHEELSPRSIAALAKYVQHSRDEGDMVATGILNSAADELMTAATAVMNRLDLTGSAFTFVLAGGMFRAVPWLCDQMQLLLPALAHQSAVMRLEQEPALGAVRLAIAELSGGANLPVYRPNVT
jgi:N-acetylglucosamine kinase-like BadF-type ATPase